MEPVQAARVFSNRYELTHLIARGGMAQVYRARDRLLDRPVALKVLFPELSVDRAFVERFRREAQAAANLSHPNIVPVFDWGEDDGTYFIVMEFIDGRPLSALLRSTGPLAPARAAGVGAKVADALSYAHRHGVVHRDVKPGNVLMTEDGQVKVTDFGIARAINTEESLTQTGAVMGTAAYFSPEQAEGFGVDARSDIYSLGVVLYEMVAGRTPFVGDSPVAVASKHVREPAPPITDFNPQVPPALEAVIAKAMAKSPDLRYSTAEELRADLLRFAEGRPVLAADPAETAALAAAGTTRLVGTTGNLANATRSVPVTDGAAAVVVPEDEARRRRTRRTVAALVVLLVAVVVVAVLLLRSLGYLGGGTFSLPNVVGQPQNSAAAKLQAKGLVIGSTSTRASNRASGNVVATDPVAGTGVKKGQRINLVVSSGPVQEVVPEVTGQDLAAAEVILSQAHLGYRVDQFVPSPKTANTVLTQNLAKGSKAPRGTVVHLTVAAAQSSVAVPNVVGLGPAAAGGKISSAQLAVGNTSSACSTTGVANGLVSATSPGSGAQEAPGTTVNLVVSSGPCATVPNVVSQTQQQASAAVTAAQLQPAVTTTTNCTSQQNGTVLTQNPGAGAGGIPTGATVTLTVCNASSSSTTTTTTSPSTSSTTTPPTAPSP
ncbi:MAG TPA: Stk1 family PASTA domain-containing Ser/Thr kinase [Acidimicrobiales bacterium]|jgi:serine/threonine-protein kinase